MDWPSFLILVLNLISMKNACYSSILWKCLAHKNVFLRLLLHKDTIQTAQNMSILKFIVVYKFVSMHRSSHNQTRMFLFVSFYGQNLKWWCLPLFQSTYLPRITVKRRQNRHEHWLKIRIPYFPSNVRFFHHLKFGCFFQLMSTKANHMRSFF